MMPKRPLKASRLDGIDEAWYQSPEGRKRIAEICAHNKGILDRLFGPGAFLDHVPQVEEVVAETVAHISDSDTPQTHNAPLAANPITNKRSRK